VANTTTSIGGISALVTATNTEETPAEVAEEEINTMIVEIH
jgi:hypothetical protein